jgi:hypothetical protein
MDPKPNDSAVASDIAAAFLRERVRSVRPIGQGSNNKNFLVETANGRAVVKLSQGHRQHRALQDYRKEKWCIEQSSTLGVPGPSVLSVGEIDGNAFMIENICRRHQRQAGRRRPDLDLVQAGRVRKAHALHQGHGLGRRLFRRHAGRPTGVMADVSDLQH